METEKKNTSREHSKKEMRAALGLLAEVLRSSRNQYTLYIAFLLAFGLAQLVPAYLFRELASFLLAPHGRASFSVLVGLAGLCGAALFALGYASTALGERTRLATEAWLRTRVLDRTSHKTLVDLESKPRGDFLSRVTQDLMEVEIFFAEDLPSYVRQASILFGTSVLFVSHSGWASVPAFLTALVLAAVSLHQHRRLIPLFRELRQKDSQVVQGLIEGFEGQRTLRSLGAQRYFKREFDTKVEAVRMVGLQASHTYALGVATGNGLSQWLMILCLGWYAILFAEGSVSREDALVYPFFLGLFYAAVQTLAASIYRWNRFFVEGARVADLIESPSCESSSELASLGPSQQTSLTDLRVRLPGGKTVGPVSLLLERGRLAVICGRSGSGKSTILETLAGLRAPLSVTGFLPQISDVAYVEQVPYFFSGTLGSNVTMGKKVADEKLWKLLSLLGLENTVKERGGLDAHLIDQGTQLSEGERYRFALARALILDRPILILDEPFAALENELVDCICEYLSEEKDRRAILIATHWVPASLDVDRRIDVEGRLPRSRVESFGLVEGVL